MNEIVEKECSKDQPIRVQRGCLEIQNKIYPIYNGINTIGRSPHAVINIKNINVSQHHAIIVVVDENKHFLSDIKSSNGTFLNYNQLQAFNLYQLNDNDLIKFGNLIAVYKRNSNNSNLDIIQIATSSSQTMSQNFYTANTQNIESFNDFHEMDTEVFDDNHIDFHDLPTQVENFNIDKNHVANQTLEIDNNRTIIDLPFTENLQIDELALSETLNENIEGNPSKSNNHNSDTKQEHQESGSKNNEDMNEMENQEIIDAATAETLQNKIVDDNDTSNDSIVFVHKCNFDDEKNNNDNHENKCSELEEQSIQETTENVVNEQLNDANTSKESSDEKNKNNEETSVIENRESIDAASTEILQCNIIDNNDTSNESMVFVNKPSEEQTIQKTTENQINEQLQDANILNENNDESSNESLDLITMQKVTQIQNKFDTDFEQTQEIKPVVLAIASRRINDSDDSGLMEKQHVQKRKSRCIISDDETDIEDDNDDDINDDNNADKSNLAPLTQMKTIDNNNTMNQSDIIPATQNVDLEEKHTTGVINDSFEDSSFALEINEKIFESSSPNAADADIFNQPTQPLNLTLIEKHRNYNEIDKFYLESTQKIDNNCDEIGNSEKIIEKVADSINDTTNSISKDNSSDNDLFALPETPKKQKQLKSNIDPKPSTSKDVEDALHDIFATQQEKFTCSQLVNILADSPIKQNKIQAINNNSNTNKSCEIHTAVIHKDKPIITINDQKVEQELETIFQSQTDLTCSQLVQILDDPKDIKNLRNRGSVVKNINIEPLEIGSDQETTAKINNKDELSIPMTVSNEENQTTGNETVKDLKKNLKKHQDDSNISLKTDSNDANKIKNVENKFHKTFKRKLSKMASDKEIEISESGRINECDNNTKKPLINIKIDSQSSLESTSSEDNFIGKSKGNRKKRPNLNLSTSSSSLSPLSKSGNETTKRITRHSLKHSNNSQSSIGSTSSDEFLDTSKTRLRKHRKSSIKNNSNEETEVSEATTDSERNLKRASRKRAATSGDNSNVSTKIRLDENTNILKVDHNISSILNGVPEKDSQSSVSTDLSSSELTETSTNTSTTCRNNKMSRRTRKNPNNTIPLLTVTVTVPNKEENSKNEQKLSKVTRGRPSKKINKSITTPSDSSTSASTSSSSTTTTTIIKTSNIRKGKRRLSANSRSMKNLEIIQEQNEIETITKTVRKKRNLQQDINQQFEQTNINEKDEFTSTPERSRRKLKPKVVFTMMDSPELESLIRQLGGMVVDSVDACTVLVAEHVKRSCKLLSAVGQGKAICSPQWLFDSKIASNFHDPWDYILKDNEAEEKWNFRLHESLERSNRRKLMENYTFQLFVNQAADVLKGAIESCGGKCVSRYSPKNYDSNFIIVANPENRSKYNKIIKQHPDILVVTPEAIFDGTLRQELQFEQHLLL